jgi:transcriptional regulator with XRE-family HTH domain
MEEKLVTSACFSGIKKALRGNLERVLSVAKMSEGEISPLTQTELSKRSGIARSSISKFLAHGEFLNANPDLQTLCRLALELNVPVAFLLMTAEDWTRLIGAVSFLPHIVDDKSLQSSVRGLPTHECAKQGLELAKKLKILVEPLEKTTPTQSVWRDDEQALHRRRHQGVRVAASLPEWALISGDANALFAICTQMGAATNIK